MRSSADMRELTGVRVVPGGARARHAEVMCRAVAPTSQPPITSFFQRAPDSPLGIMVIQYWYNDRVECGSSLGVIIARRGEGDLM